MLQTEEAQSGMILWWPRSKAKMYPICCRSAGQPLTAYGRTKRRTEPLDSSRPSQVPSSNKDVGPSVQTKSHLQPFHSKMVRSKVPLKRSNRMHEELRENSSQSICPAAQGLPFTSPMESQHWSAGCLPEIHVFFIVTGVGGKSPTDGIAHLSINSVKVGHLKKRTAFSECQD